MTQRQQGGKVLDKAITFLQKHLNNQLKGEAIQDRVVLAKLQRDYVELAPEAVTVILVGLEPDAISRAANPRRATVSASSAGPVYPEIRLNLHLLFAARSESYETALRHVSAIIRYFQHMPVLTQHNAPDMDPAIDKLVMELQELSYKQQNDIWSMLKVAAVPSALYRVRMVVFEQGVSATPRIVETDTGISAQ